MFIPAYHNTLKQALDLEKRVEEERIPEERERNIELNKYGGISEIIVGAGLALIGAPVVGLPLVIMGYGHLQRYAKQKGWFLEDQLISEEYKQTIFPKKTYSLYGKAGIGLTAASASAVIAINSIIAINGTEFDGKTLMMNLVSAYFLLIGLKVIKEDADDRDNNNISSYKR